MRNANVQQSRFESHDDEAVRVYDAARHAARIVLKPGKRVFGCSEPTDLVHQWLFVAGSRGIGLLFRLTAELERHVDIEAASAGQPTHVALFAKIMRNCLIDHWRAMNRIKRRPPRSQMPFELVDGDGRCVFIPDLTRLQVAMEKLGCENSDRALIIDLKFFAGLTHKEIASRLGVSEKAIEHRWARARDQLRAIIRRL